MPLSGEEMKRLFEKSGWRMARQRGSHMIMVKDNKTVPIPNHRELKPGTEHWLLKKLRGAI